jgi:hypothetical protein
LQYPFQTLLGLVVTMLDKLAASFVKLQKC